MPDKTGEKGVPGEGKGRREDVRGSGIYPASGPFPEHEAPVVEQGGLGATQRGGVPMRIRPERVRDLMTRDPVSILPDITVATAATIMLDRDVGLLPVVESIESKKLIGVLTDRDLAIRIAAEGLDPRTTRTGEIMTRDPGTCSPDDHIDAVIEVMEKRQVRRVPIVDNTGRLVGIVAQADLALRSAEPEKVAEVVEHISRPKAA